MDDVEGRTELDAMELEVGLALALEETATWLS